MFFALSDKWATKLFLGHVMKLGGHHIGKPVKKGQRFLPCAEVVLTYFDIPKSISADPRRRKVHIRSGWWGSLSLPGGATMIDLWVTGHFNQSKWLGVISGV